MNDDGLLIGIDLRQFTGLGNQRDAQNLLQELGGCYPGGCTHDGGVRRDYQARGMPTLVFITSEGEVT